MKRTHLFGAALAIVCASVLSAQTIQVDTASISLSAQVGGSPASQTLNVTSSGASIAFVAAANAQWLKLNGNVFANGNTPSAITVTADPAGLAAGTYTGQITVSGGTGANINVQVTFTVGSIGVNPASVAFSAVVGSVPPAQTIALSGQPTPFTAAASTTSGGNWLQVSPTSGVSPASLAVTFDPAVVQTLAAGTYRGSVVITPTSGPSITPITIPVTLNLTTSPPVSVNPKNITLNYQIGGANNAQASQNLVITNSGATTVSFSATPSVDNNPSGRIWLLANPSSGLVQANGTATVAVSYDASANLPAGTYGGNATKITLSTPGAAPATQDIPVTLLVSNAPLLNVPNTTLTFNYQTGGGNPASQNVTATSTAVAASATSGQMPITISATTSGAGGNWLSVPSTGITGTPFAVSVNPAGLAPGTYTGSVTVTGTGAANGPQSFPVTLVVSNDPLILANGCSASTQAGCALVFPYQIGQALPAQQSVRVTSTTGAPLNYSATFSSEQCGGQWLLLGGASGGQTAGTFTVSVNPAPLAAATTALKCTGNVVIVATNPSTGAAAVNSPLNVPVSLVIDTNPLLTVSPISPLTFNAQLNGGTTASQTITLGSTNPATPLNYSVSFTPANGGNWLLVGPPSGSTSPGSNQITVAANPGILSAGTYNGTLNITATNPGGAAVGNSPVAIPITLQVAAASTLGTNPGSVSFAYTLQGQAPPSQTVQLTSSGQPLPFSAAATVTSGPTGWLSVTPSTGQTPGALTIAIDATRFTAAGTFNGTVTITSPGAGNSPATIPVTVTVSQPAAPVLTAVRNAASYSPAAISPGENIVIGGTRVGPASLAGLQLTSNGNVATTIANTRVLFDGIPAPIVYVSENQTSVIVPYEIAGRATTNIQVEYQGVTSNALSYAVAQAAPGIYSQNQQGVGPGAILNQDNTLNGSGNAAAKGSVVVVYMTGEGQTSPSGATGSVTPNNGSGLKRPVLPVTATVGGAPATVLYSGSAPGFVSGVMQVNLQIPANAPSGAQPLIVTVGGTSSQAGVTVAVQ